MNNYKNNKNYPEEVLRQVDEKVEELEKDMGKVRVMPVIHYFCL